MLASTLLGTILTFTLPATPMDDGGAVAGSFAFDTVGDAITDVDLTTSGGKRAPFEYTRANSQVEGDHTYLAARNQDRRLALTFAFSVLAEPGLYSLGNAGVLTTGVMHGSFEDTDRLNFRRYLVGTDKSPTTAALMLQGTASSAAVPEPTVLMWAAFFLLAVRALRAQDPHKRAN